MTKLRRGYCLKHSCKLEAIAEKIDGRLRKAFLHAWGGGQETSPIEYLYLPALIELFKSLNHDKHALLDQRLSGLLDKIRPFRNKIMHANSFLAACAGIASIGSLPSWATEVSDALSRIIESLVVAPVTSSDVAGRARP